MARLRSAIVASGLLRAAEAAGGNGAVIARGDADAGALLLIVTVRGVCQAMLERISGPSGDLVWNQVELGDSVNEERVARLIDGKKRFDRDLWIVELDVPHVEQFIADSLGVS